MKQGLDLMALFPFICGSVFSFSLGSFSYFLVFPLRFWHLLEKRFVGLRVNKVASCSGSMSFSRGERALQAALEEELCSAEMSGICVWER